MCTSSRWMFRKSQNDTAIQHIVISYAPHPQPGIPHRHCAIKPRSSGDFRHWVRSFPFAYHLRMRNLLPTFSRVYVLAMRRGFLRLRGFCALSPVAQAAVFRPVAVSPAPTFCSAGKNCL